MRFLSKASISRKQIAVVMLTTGVALLLACGGFLAFEWIAFRQEAKHGLVGLASRIADRNAGYLSFEDNVAAKNSLATLLREEPSIVLGAVYNSAGEPFAVYLRDSREQRTLPVAPAPGFGFGFRRLTLVHDVTLAGEVIGAVYLESDLRAMRERLVRYGWILSVVFLVSSLVAWLLSTSLQKLISKPILHLVDTARRVSHEKNYSLRATKSADDEVGALIDGFNQMLSQIQQRDAALQQAHDELEKRVQERTRELTLEVGERRRAEESLQQQLARISLLNQITHAISERQDLKSILHVVLRQLEDHLPIDFGAVLLYDSKSEMLSVAAVKAKAPVPMLDLSEDSALAVAETGLRPCIERRMLHCAHACLDESRFLQRLGRAGLRSVVAVPLLVENDVFGILLGARHAPESFREGDCEFFQMLSEHVALAAHQASLHEKLRDAYEELRQTQQAVMQQERLRALGKMASGIAHDINNALSPIVVYAELLLRKETQLSEQSRKHLNQVKIAADDIAHIVARMREFYRRREQNEPLFGVQLNELAGQVIDLTRPRWRDIPQQRGTVIQMETDLVAGLPLVQGNASEIREAVTNLILNAVDAMPAGGKLTVRTRVCGWQQSHAAIEVVDTGVGMDEETRTRCLEPFYSTKGQRGTGLGLAMVYGIMERHEGSIEVESAPGVGTTMRLLFPIREASEIAAAESEPPKPSRSLRILCIDDEPLIRQLLKELLEFEGHDVTVADGGQAGIEMFEAAAEKPFDVVITDLGMPYVDGRQVAATLKRQSPSTPIILLTGWGTMMKSERDIPAQVDAILSKPPRINELQETLARLTDAAGAS